MSHSNRDCQAQSMCCEESINQAKEACAPPSNEPHFQFIDLCRRLENLRRQLYPTSQISYRLKPQSISIERPQLAKPAKRKAILPSIAEHSSIKYGAEKIRAGLCIKDAKPINSEPCSNISFNIGFLSCKMANSKWHASNKLPLLAIKASLEGKLSEHERNALKDKANPKCKYSSSEMKSLLEMLKPHRIQRCNFRVQSIQSVKEFSM